MAANCPIEDSAAPIKDSAGNAIGVVLVFHDVTERRRAQEALREAHERAVWLARFPDANPNPIFAGIRGWDYSLLQPGLRKGPRVDVRVGQVLQNELLLLVERAIAEGREGAAGHRTGRNGSISVWSNLSLKNATPISMDAI